MSDKRHLIGANAQFILCEKRFIILIVVFVISLVTTIALAAGADSETAFADELAAAQLSAESSGSTSISVDGKAVSGAASDWDDYYYEFSLSRKTAVKLSVTWTNSAGYSGFGVSDIYSVNDDPDYTSSRYSSPYENTQILPAGTYRFCVSGWDGTEYTCKLTDVSKLATSLTVDDITVHVADTAEPTVHVLPAETDVTEFSYSIADTRIATVNSDGVVTGKAEGATTITVIDRISGLTKSAMVTVLPKWIDATESDKTAQLKLGKTAYGKAGEWNTVKFTFNLEHAMRVKLNISWGEASGVIKELFVSDFDDESESRYLYNNDYEKHEHSKTQTLTEGKHTISVWGCDNIPFSILLQDASTYVNSITVKKLSLYAGNTAQLKTTVSPTSANVRDLQYKSANTHIAKVDENGKVIGVKPGKTTITVTDAASGTKSKASVIVKAKTIIAKNVSMYVGGAASTNAKVKQASTNGTNLKYKSSNAKVAKVNAKGKVTGVKPGKATITITDTVSGAVKKVAATVKAKTIIAKNVSMYVGGAASTNAKVKQASTNGTNLKYKSSNAKVAKVSAKGKVTGVKPGKATITITDTVSGAVKKVTATVKAVPISRKGSAKREMFTYDQAKLGVHSAVKIPSLTWKSSKPAVVTVTKGGKIVAKRAGRATIAASTPYGKPVKWNIWVKRIPASLVRMSNISDRTYTADSIEPSVNVTYKGKSLKRGRDYTVSYENNVNMGTARAVVTLTENYEGKLERTFQIVAPNVGEPTITYWFQGTYHSRIMWDGGSNSNGSQLVIEGGGNDTYDEHLKGDSGYGYCDKAEPGSSVTFSLRSYKIVGDMYFYSDWVSETL